MPPQSKPLSARKVPLTISIPFPVAVSLRELMQHPAGLSRIIELGVRAYETGSDSDELKRKMLILVEKLDFAVSAIALCPENAECRKSWDGFLKRKEEPVKS